MRWVLIAAFALPGAVLAEETCPARFDQFLERFESDRVFQQERTTDPLQYTFLDYAAQPEPKEQRKRLSKAELAQRKDAIFPSPATQKSHGLSIKKIADLPKSRKWVRIAKPDTGYQLDYYFDKTAACWTLTAHSNLST